LSAPHVGGSWASTNETEASCPCGAVVKGPTARMMAAKMDYFDGTVDQALLIVRARMEMEEVLAQAELDDLESVNKAGKSQKKKKKKIKSDNRGNFSYFRNKTFIPNASRGSKSEPSKSVSLKAQSDEMDDVEEEYESNTNNQIDRQILAEGIRESQEEVEQQGGDVDSVEDSDEEDPDC